MRQLGLLLVYAVWNISFKLEFGVENTPVTEILNQPTRCYTLWRNMLQEMTLILVIQLMLLATLFFPQQCMLASSPGLFEKSEKTALYLLFAHALNFPTFRESRIIPCHLRVLWHQVRVFCRTFLSYTADNGYLCSRLRFCRIVCLPVTSRRSDGANICAFMLVAYGFWQVTIRVTKL